MPRRSRTWVGAAMLALTAAACGDPAATTRLAAIQQRGHLVCGVAPGVNGFAAVGSDGRYRGFDVDMCRAMAAAIFGNPDAITYVQATSVEEFLRSTDVDVVSRRLTVSLTREGLGLLFGPVTFYDGQGFLVSKALHAQHVDQLSGAKICVDAGTLFESNLGTYFSAHSLTLDKQLIASRDQRAAGLTSGQCQAFSADLSELGGLRAQLPQPLDFDLLPDLISREPLAQVVRREDVDLYQILRWTVFAMIDAEALGVTSTNIDQMAGSGNPELKRLLGIVPGNGQALGLSERWAYTVIKTVGNYGESFERNLGLKSPVGLARGLNNLWTAGGLIYAPPLR